ncbi:hypothetical protein NIES39_C02690 [Arthrospira platensis NIES-39]|nr:hypothetical protein NIES39_C02690 [Arthrospira platensis NIES-39]
MLKLFQAGELGEEIAATSETKARPPPVEATSPSNTIIFFIFRCTLIFYLPSFDLAG